MKRFLVLFLSVCLMSCAKEELHGPLNLKNGEIVELLVDHQYGSTNDNILKLPNKVAAGADLYNFQERQPGYTYRVKAKFVFTKEPPQDSPSYWYEFVNIVSQEQHKGINPFEIELIRSYIPGGPTIQMSKKGDDYLILSEKVALTSANETIRKQLEEIWQNSLSIRDSATPGQLPKWKSINATVTHDPLKFGKAYLVQQIKFELQ